MTELIDLQDLTKSLTKPYVITRSKLGSNTKIIRQDFICSPKELERLFYSIGEKIKSYNPTKAGFQYLISFNDNTHIENSKITSLSDEVDGSDKETDKVIFNWIIGHQLDEIENEMSITIRISNPMNPLVMLQAALSKNHAEADLLDFEGGSISVSIHGATQNASEELFSIVEKWARGCPQPKSITGINALLSRNQEKVRFLNSWLFPILFGWAGVLYLQKIDANLIQPYSLAFFIGFFLIRDAARIFNQKFSFWCRYSSKFSIFTLTGGDENQQTAFAALSKNSTIKLVIASFFSFSINVFAGIFVAWYLKL